MDRRYRVEIAPAARRQLDALPPKVQRRIGLAIDRLQVDPRPSGVTNFAATPDQPLWRVRVGGYRVVYQVHDDRLLVLVIRIGHRGSVCIGSAEPAMTHG